jgi:hypothetical protein
MLDARGVLQRTYFQPGGDLHAGELDHVLLIAA